MTRGPSTVRLLACVAAALISCVFVSLYSWASALTLDRGMALPAVARVVVSFMACAYAFPGAVLFLGAVQLRKYPRSVVAFECLVACAWLGALFWVLTAIYAWQVVHIELYSGPH